MRVILATLELASGSEEPRPTTTSSVSPGGTGLAGGGERLADAGGGGLDHAALDAELAAIVDGDAALGGIAVEHRGDVVLGMAGGEEHAGDGQDAGDAAGHQGIEAVADDGRGKFQIAVLERPVREGCAQPAGKVGELGRGQPVAAAMTADHDAKGHRSAAAMRLG